MSKPIKLTQRVMEEMQAEFLAALQKMKMSDGKVTYTRQFAYEGDEKAELVFSTMAFAKMTMLVQSFDCEIAWHACTRRDPENVRRFYVDDILVYPQEVTGVTVTMDEVSYARWLMEHDGDERFDNIHFQGHSHVNMGVSPSSTDLDHQEEILAQLPGGSYYIFLIMNKKFEYTVKVFDLANNILYENKEVDILLGEDGVDLNAFVAEARELAPKKSAVTAAKQTAQTPAKPYQWGQNSRSGKGYDDYLEDYYQGYYGYPYYRK